MVVQKRKTETNDMSRIRRSEQEKVEENVTISVIVTREQKRKLALHKAETGQSVSDFIRELLDLNL